MLERRSKGQRRWGLDNEYPLVDSNGVTVLNNRRRMPDRRLHEIPMEDRLTLLSEMPPPLHDREKDH